MKVRVLFLLLVLLVSVVAGSQNTTAQEGGDFVTYNGGVFTIQHPAHWHVSSMESFEAFVAIFSPTEITIGPEDFYGDALADSQQLIQAIKEFPLAGVIAVRVENVGGEPREVVEEIMDELDIRRTERARPVTIGDAEGVEVVGFVNGEGELKGRVFGAHGVALQKGDWFLLFVGTGQLELFEQYRDTFDTMAQSIVLSGTAGLDMGMPTADAGDVAFTTYEGGSYTIEYPASWRVSAVETFDGSLALFSPQAIDLTNDDLETFIYDAEGVSNPSFFLALRTQPIAGMVVISANDYFSLDDPVEAMQDLIEELDVQTLERARPVVIGSISGAEAVGMVRGKGPLDGTVFGVHSVMMGTTDWIVLFAGGGHQEVFNQNRAIFNYMAHSIRVR